MNELFTQIAAFILTTLVEFIIIFLVLKDYKWTTILLYSTLINCVSWPLAVRLYDAQVFTFFETESLVFLIECLLLGVMVQERYRKIVLSVLLANSVTAILSFMFA